MGTEFAEPEKRPEKKPEQASPQPLSIPQSSTPALRNRPQTQATRPNERVIPDPNRPGHYKFEERKRTGGGRVVPDPNNPGGLIYQKGEPDTRPGRAVPNPNGGFTYERGEPDTRPGRAVPNPNGGFTYQRGTPDAKVAADPQQQLGQGSQPQLIAQTPTQPKGHWETDYIVHPGSKDGTVKLIYSQPNFGEGQMDVKNKVWPANGQDSDTFQKGALPSSQAMDFSGQIVRRDAKGKTITIPFKAGVPIKLQPGDQIQEFVREQPGTQKTNAPSQATPVDTFKAKLSNNALKRLQDNSNRLKSELKDYQNLSPNNPKWQQLRQLSVKDQQLVQHSRRLDGQISELIIKDRKENSFTSPNVFIDRDDVHPLGVVSPQIQAQIKQIESQQALLKIARRQMQAQYPALAVVDSAKVASSSNQELLGNINQGFGQIQGNIGDLQKQIQADPSKALFLDDVVKGTLSGLKVDPNNPKQTKTGKEIKNWLQGEQTKHNLIKWGGTLLTGGLTVGAIITTLASEGLALPFWLGLGGAVTGLGTAVYEYKELATVDLAAQAQQGGGGNLTSQDKDTARFNLMMGRVNLLMAGLDLGLSVKALTGMLKGAKSVGQLNSLTKEVKQGFTIKEPKFDYFFGRVASNPKNQTRSLQNLRDLKTLGIDENLGGRDRLMEIFKSGLNSPAIKTKTSEYGKTVIKQVEVVGEEARGAIEISYFYPKGDLSAIPEITTIIPKIYKGK
jgi:hypothetical protein